MRRQGLMLALGWLVAFTAIALCWALWRQIENRLEIEADLRRDPLGLRTLETPPAASDDSDSRIVLLIGDSRAADLGVPAVPGWTILNRGIPGQTTEQVAARLGQDLILLDPDHVIVIAGINDLKQGDADTTIETADRGLERIARMLDRSGVSGLVVPIWGAGRTDTPRAWLLPADLDERVAEVNRRTASRIEALPRIFGVELDPLLGEDSKVKGSFSRDALHLNRAGNERLAEIILDDLPNDEVKDD